MKDGIITVLGETTADAGEVMRRSRLSQQQAEQTVLRWIVIGGTPTQRSIQ